MPNIQDSLQSELGALTKKPFRYYFGLKRRTFAIGLTALVFTNLLDAAPPLIIGLAIDQIASGKPGLDVLSTVSLFALVTFLLMICRYVWRIHWGTFHNSVANHLRSKIFNKLTFLGPSFYQKNPVGQLMSLITNDVTAFRMGIGPGILILFDGLLIITFTLPVMIYLSPSWTWKALILMPLIPLVINKLTKVIHSRYRKQQDRFSEMSGRSQEIISGIRVIKGFSQEDSQTSLFNAFSKRFENSCNDVVKADAAFGPFMELGVSVGSVILLIVGAPEVISGAITIGTFFAFYQYIQRMVWPMTALGLGLSFIQQGKASFKRISELLEEKFDISDRGSDRIGEFKSLEVKNLTFTYPGEDKPTLNNVSFRLEAGQTLGVLGVTGSGKSTLLEALCRLYPSPSNSIFINDKPVEDFGLDDLRTTVSVVPQEPFLFSEKISHNIAINGAAKHEEIIKMAELVNIEKEIDDTPDGYDTFLGERGVNLSGGQKQRLTIARALIRKSPVVLLDDSLSAVDAKTEARILNGLKSHVSSQAKDQPSDQHRKTPVTSIIVTHRLASIMWADKILILKDGEVEGLGNHQELLASSNTYQDIFKLQQAGDIYEH